MKRSFYSDNSPLLSVVICTYKRPELLRKCLEQVCYKQTVDRNTYEVIVSDDNSDGITKKMVDQEFPLVKYFKGPEKGFGANRNNGSKEARGDWLVFTDDDCLPESQWLETYYNAITQNTDAKVLEGKTITDRPQMRFDEQAPINEEGGKLWGCNLAVEKETYFKVGGYPEDFSLYMEDIEFHVKVKEANYSILFLEQAVVCHPYRRSIPIKKYFYIINATKRIIDRHPDLKANYTFRLLLKIAVTKTSFNFITLLKYRLRGVRYFIAYTVFSFYKVVALGFYYPKSKFNNEKGQ